MTKRYAYWRMPTGQPYRGSDDRYALVTLLSDIGKSATINKEGKVQWEGFSLQWLETALNGAIIILDANDEELNSSDCWEIVRTAIRDLILSKGGQSAVLPSELMTAINPRAAAFFRQAVKSYVLVTSLSVASFPVGNMTIGECSIAPLAKRQSRYIKPTVLDYEKSHSRYGKHITSSRYCPIRIKVQGRTANEATAKALHALHLLRGYWNFFATYGRWSFSFGSPRKPFIGVIHAGPIHTLHNHDGRPIDDVYWYEPDYVEDAEVFTPQKSWDDIEKRRRWAMNRVKRLEYRRDMEGLLIRYALALDQPNLDVAFLRLWAMLEKITGTVGANYDETIRRTVWPFQDRNHSKETLSTLRFRRNLLVHAAEGGNNSDQAVYMIKRFIDPHLIYLIRNTFEVSSLDQYGLQMALPTEIDELDRQRQRYSLAISKLKKWSASSK